MVMVATPFSSGVDVSTSTSLEPTQRYISQEVSLQVISWPLYVVFFAYFEASRETCAPSLTSVTFSDLPLP